MHVNLRQVLIRYWGGGMFVSRLLAHIFVLYVSLCSKIALAMTKPEVSRSSLLVRRVSIPCLLSTVFYFLMSEPTLAQISKALPLATSIWLIVLFWSM